MRALVFICGAIIMLLGIGGFAGFIVSERVQDETGKVVANNFCLITASRKDCIPAPSPVVDSWKKAGFIFIETKNTEHEANPFH